MKTCRKSLKKPKRNWQNEKNNTVKKLTLLLTRNFYAIILALTFITSAAFASTKDQDVEKKYINQPAAVKVFICSRGCYQYLIELKFEDEFKYFFPDSLPKEFKQDNLEVIITGTISSDKKQVYKPSPNDLPVADFLAPVIVLESIEFNRE